MRGERETGRESERERETTQMDSNEEGEVANGLFEGIVETGATDCYLEDDESEGGGLTTDSEGSGETDHSTGCC